MHYFNAFPLLVRQDLFQVVQFLKEGKLVAIPTETVYGLAGDLFQERAIQEIFRVKGRPADNPLIAHISNLNQLDRLILPPSDLFYRLAERFWPGPLTLVTDKNKEVPLLATAQLSTLAVRMPAHPCARQIIDTLNSPLVAPSANRSGFPSATSAQDVREDFGEAIAALVDGGTCSFGIESTVVSLLEDRPRLLRKGALACEALEEALGMHLETPLQGDPVRSPGMKYRHYAPKATVYFVEPSQPIEDAYVPSDLSPHNLYAHLRQADRMGYKKMAIVLTPAIRNNEVLMDRLQRIV